MSNQVDLAFVAHEPNNSLRSFWVCWVNNSHASIKVVSSQTVNHGLDWFQGTLMEDKIFREDVHYNGCEN